MIWGRNRREIIRWYLFCICWCLKGERIRYFFKMMECENFLIFFWVVLFFFSFFIVVLGFGFLVSVLEVLGGKKRGFGCRFWGGKDDDFS